MSLHLKMNTTTKNSIFYILGIFFIFLLWLIISLWVKNDYTAPTIPLTFNALFNLLKDPNTYKILGLTLLRLLVSISISFIISLILALLSTKFKAIKSFLSPELTLIKTMPIVVIIILLLVLLKKEIVIYVITSFVILPIMYEGILLGFESIDKTMLEDIKTVSSFNMLIAFKIYIPLALPYILTTLIQSLGLGLKVAVMAEYLSQPTNSIGQELMFYKNYAYEMEYVLAWSIILIVIVLVLEIILKKLKKKYLIN